VHIKWKGYWRFSTNISLYFENGTRYGHSYNRRRIGTPTRSIECVILGVRPAPDHPHCLIEIKFGMRGSTPDVDWVFFFGAPKGQKSFFHHAVYTRPMAYNTQHCNYLLPQICRSFCFRFASPHLISGISFLYHFVSLLNSFLHIHHISLMAVHVHHHHFYPLNSSFSLSAQNISFSRVFPTIDFWYLTPGLPSRT